MHYMNIYLTPAQLFLPLIALWGTWGWRRAWQEETWTGIIFLVGLIIYARIQDSLLDILNRIVSAILTLFLRLLPQNSATAVNPTSSPLVLSQASMNVLAMLMLAVTAYLLGGSLGKRKGLKAWGHYLGVVLGVLNATIVLSTLLSVWYEWGKRPGILTTAKPLPRVDIPAIKYTYVPPPINIDIKHLIINSTLPALPSYNVMSGWTLWGTAIFILILLIVAITRGFPRISE